MRAAVKHFGFILVFIRSYLFEGELIKIHQIALNESYVKLNCIWSIQRILHVPGLAGLFH